MVGTRKEFQKGEHHAHRRREALWLASGWETRWTVVKKTLGKVEARLCGA